MTIRYTVTLLTFLIGVASASHGQIQVLYGTTYSGGDNGTGTIIKIYPDGAIIPEYSFPPATNPGINAMRSSFVEVNDKLYSVAFDGGLFGAGLLYEYDLSSGTYTVLKDFESAGRGRMPMGNIAFSGGNVFGVTSAGGGGDNGTLFMYRISDGSLIRRADFPASSSGPTGASLAPSGKLYGLTTRSYGSIYEFDPSNNALTIKFDFNGTDGQVVNTDGLTLAGNGKFYGTTSQGGSAFGGTLFEFDPASGVHTTKKDFNSSIGMYPNGPLFLAANNFLYGCVRTASGAWGIFEYDPGTDNYNVRATFANASENDTPTFGAQASNGKMYGTSGGDASTIFEFDPTTYVLTKKLNFDVSVTGSWPRSGVVMASNGKLYGSTSEGGAGGSGTIFEFDPSNGPAGTLTKKIDFNVSSGPASPLNSLVSGPGGELYGVSHGGPGGTGTIFQYDPATRTCSTRFLFNAPPTTGAGPVAGMALASNGKFYGTTIKGGLYDNGVIYEFDPVSGVTTKMVDLAPATVSSIFDRFVAASNGKFYTVGLFGGANGAGAIVEYVPGAITVTNRYDFTFSDGLPIGPFNVTSNNTLLGKSTSGNGLIYEFDPSNGNFTSKVSLDGVSAYQPWGQFTSGITGKFYGIAVGGGANGAGTVFEYSYPSTSITKKADFDAITGRAGQGDFIAVPWNSMLYALMPYGGVLNGGSLVAFDPVLGNLFKKNDFVGFNGIRPEKGSMVVSTVSPFITTFTAKGLDDQYINIEGGNFDPQAVVKFNGLSANDISNPNFGRITVRVPPGAITGPITVTVNGVTVTTATDFIAQPHITTMASSSAGVGQEILLLGKNFDETPSNNTVTFNGTQAVVTASSKTSLTVTIPPGATTGPVSVTVNGLSDTFALPFTVLPPMTITGFTPSSGPIGSSVTITGTNFETAQNMTVTVNSFAAAITAASSTSITATVGPGSSTGPISVISLTRNLAPAISATNFTVTAVVTTGDLHIIGVSDFVVYPNPSKDEIIVVLDAFEKGNPVEIFVYDMLGTLLEKLSAQAQDRIAIDVRSYGRGNYVLRAVQSTKSSQYIFSKN